MLTPLLEVDGIETCYGLSQVLFGLSLQVRDGEMVAMMGRNGMGKTTTIRSIMGLTPARAGAIRFAGHDVRKLPSFRIAQLRNRAGARGAPDISEPDGAREPHRGLRQSPAAAPIPGRSKRSTRCSRGSPSAATTWAGTLSGGEQQMLAIGRALMTNPRLLILDEATEGLAPLIREEIWNCLSIAQSARSIGPGHRQEHRKSHRHRRPPLHHRARPGGVERHLAGADRRARSAASLSRGLMAAVIPGRGSANPESGSA